MECHTASPLVRHIESKMQYEYLVSITTFLRKYISSRLLSAEAYCRKCGNYFTNSAHTYICTPVMQAKRAEEMRTQLLEHDRDGLTVAMHAARGGNVVVLEAVLGDICGVDVRML